MSSSDPDTSRQAINAAKKLRQNVAELDFSSHVACVYNPLDYAWKAHEQYLQRYARRSCRVIFLGMNPGPWGMAQTGVPFGEVAAARDWLRIDAPIRRPADEHPKRPVEGFNCKRSEVSGRRLWGLFAKRFTTADAFFEEHFVANYCPLVFMKESAQNLTPDKLPMVVRRPLETACDKHLGKLVQVLSPSYLVGVGAWAESCARRVVDQLAIADVQIGRILHPSPASPASNKDWAGAATRQLKQLGVW